MSTSNEVAVMRLALEALQFMDSNYISLPQQGMQAIKALEEELAKQEQSVSVGEPVVKKPLVLRKLINGFHERYMVGQNSEGHEIVMLPPIEWRHLKHLMIELDTNWQTYTTPQQRTWVGMTPEETLDWLAQQHFDQCREARPIQDWIRKMKSQLPAQTELCKYGQEPKSCTSSPMDCQCAIDAALAQPEQEPVAKYISETWCGSVVSLYDEIPLNTFLYTTPPQHSAIARKPLTDEQIYELWTEQGLSKSYDIYSLKEHVRRAARAIEAAHGITEDKNT